MKRLIETIGPDAALAVLTRRQGRTAQSAPLLSDWLERHLAMLASSATPGTVAEYRRMAARTWLPSLGPLPLDAIDREAVRTWVAWQRRQPSKKGGTYQPKSIKNAHGLLSSILAGAVEAGYLTKNVAHGAPLPSDDAGREMEIFTDAEWQAFITAMDAHYRPLTMFLLVTGCRIGEATAVQVRDLDLTGARPTVRFQRAWKKAEQGVYLGSTKSRRGRRTVVLSPAIVPVLLEVIKGKAAGDFVFTTRQGKHPQATHFRARQWARALRAAGITKHLTPHSLRHTGASWLLRDGTSPMVVQRRLGHESLSTTSKVYAHLLTDDQVPAAALMDRAMARPAIEAAYEDDDEK